jgi:ABC-type lipoprotein export system ATPase subunit
MRQRADPLLAALGLAEHGQQPAVILADEQTGTLNSAASEQVFRIPR